MSNAYGVTDFMRAAAAQRAELESQVREANHYASVHRNKKSELAKEYEEAAGDLARALLPVLTRESVKRAVGITGFSTLTAEDPVSQLENQRLAIAQRIAEIDADPRYANRELLRHPTTGSLTRQSTELEGYAKPLREVLERAEHPRLSELITKGYGTAEYSVPFWRVSYYSDWKAGDEILERFPDKQFFGAVRDEVVRAREGLEPIDAEIKRLGAEIAAIDALAKERKERERSLRSAEGRWLRDVQHRLVSFVAGCPMDAIGPRLANEPDIALQYKRLSAVAAKATYLDAMIEKEVKPVRESAELAIQKIDRDVAKLSRPKKASTQFPAEQFQKRFRPRQDAYKKRWSRFERNYVTVYSYDRYDEAPLGSSFLWWDLMTDGELDGNFIPEVHRYRDAHPGYVYARPAGRDEDDDLTSSAAVSLIDDSADEALLTRDIS